MTSAHSPFTHRQILIIFTGLMAGLLLAPVTGAEESTWELETWVTPFDYTSKTNLVNYQPLEKAQKKWRICASYPHLKDSYWLSVNYGMVLEAERLGVALQVVEAGRLGQLLFFGDTLFAGSIGRTDLPGGDHALLLRSIREVLLPFGDEAEVYPGHGPKTTIGDERRTNPFLVSAT